jgi:hypothetical protein
MQKQRRKYKVRLQRGCNAIKKVWKRTERSKRTWKVKRRIRVKGSSVGTWYGKGRDRLGSKQATVTPIKDQRKTLSKHLSTQKISRIFYSCGVRCARLIKEDSLIAFCSEKAGMEEREIYGEGSSDDETDRTIIRRRYQFRERRLNLTVPEVAVQVPEVRDLQPQVQEPDVREFMALPEVRDLQPQVQEPDVREFMALPEVQEVQEVQAPGPEVGKVEDSKPDAPVKRVRFKEE